jgi:hypothetical protein
MSEQQETSTKYNDSLTDAISVTIIIATVVAMAVYWVVGQ